MERLDRTSARWLFCSLLAALLASTFAVPAGAAGGPNIIVIMADDLDWTDLPFFNPPIEWRDPSQPVPATQPDPVQPRREAERRTPELNRLFARMLADRSGFFGSTSDGSKIVPVDLDYVLRIDELAGQRKRRTDPAYTTNPAYADFTVGGGSFWEAGTPSQPCKQTNPAAWKDDCRPADDILEHHGGLAEIASQGVVFSRFYSSSARCSPARASFMTGQSDRMAGVQDINATTLPSNQITIAQFLKQGCHGSAPRLCLNPDWLKGEPANQALKDCDCYGNACDRACYTTGLIGKWHLGTTAADGTMPWQRGFDEVVTFPYAWRPYWSKKPLACSPDTRTYDDVAGFALPQPNGLYIGPNPASITRNACVTPSTSCCSPQDGAIPRAEFDFPDSYGKDDDTTWPCADDGPTNESRCLYYTRVIRDHAVNFIKRHAADSNPFFLTVTFTATHKPRQAPKRTEAHYSAPSETRFFKENYFDDATPPGAKYWAMLEELDAAVGSILNALDTSEPAVRNNTYVFFLSDQGKGRPYGDPNLRGGKSSVWEGGVRVGLLAMGPGIRARRIPESEVAGMIDLFPTIAEIAGYDVGNDGRVLLNRCSITGDPCPPSPAVCPDVTIGLRPQKQKCGRLLEGRSILGLLTGERPAPRDYVYSHFIKDTSAVMTRAGYVPDGVPDYADSVWGFKAAKNVCSTDGLSPCNEACASAGGTCQTIRTVRGASCEPCTSATRDCYVLGKVCANTRKPEYTDCSGGSPAACAEAITDMPRCLGTGDCPGEHERCIDAVVTCNACMPAAWKQRAGTNELFELTTNPEEDKKTIQGIDALNCYRASCACASGDASCSKVCGVQRKLGSLLSSWDRCQSNPGCNGYDCEDGTAPCVLSIGGLALAP